MSANLRIPKVRRRQLYAEAVTWIKARLSTLSLSLAEAEQDMSKMFSNLCEKVEHAKSLANGPNPSMDDLEAMTSALEDCEQLMTVIHGSRILGGTGWEQVSLEEVSDEQRKPIFSV